ncbi:MULTISPECIES: omptin family outer membrane protease [unclassified Legionella]|uniref:omptin family outer membrane protease n=1 Tax=unclassified Legionella TaxID=2622702 RepID=UPI001056901D|nr:MULTISPECIES: omptin family outer membrane protease [unclassified Legionella]MDI9819310.1 omptin family outer membrane protease [Legionella sp. PL877]
MKIRTFLFIIFYTLSLTAAGGTSSINDKSVPQSPLWDSVVGLRYWYSTGNSSWNHDPSGVEPFLGNPGSVLSYDDMDAHSGEIFFQLTHKTGLFAKGFLATGSIKNGNLNDKDYLSGQVRFSDTTSSLRNGDLDYLSIDFGGNFYENNSLDQRNSVYLKRVGGFAGYFYWQEDVHAYGVRCNPDDFGGLFCGPPGFIETPYSTNVLSNKARWRSFRIGLTADVNLHPKFTLNGEIAYVPIAHLKNEDSHHMRSDLGPVPNILMDANGQGFMADLIASYKITSQLNIGVGARYWEFISEGSILFANTVSLPLNDFKSKRYGVFVQASYAFA